MSCIEKLSIRGIRSFSPNREETIEFLHPLTVIVGENGCGKTTIIECLKYNCTGILPPNSNRGQSFVFDPKLNNSTETKACIRLRIRNRGGQQMVIQRSIQVLQLKAKLQFKALDGAIRTMDKNGNTISMGHQCTELDVHVPDLLGVSAAILENVVFCHQEDSNWPLQDSSLLKKKFDDIFESARYTKALDAMLKLKKKHMGDSKGLQADLRELAVYVGQRNGLEVKKNGLVEKKEQAVEEMKELSMRIEILEKEIQEYQQGMDQCREEHFQKKILTERVVEKQKQVNERFEGMEQVMEDTDSELQHLMDNYDNIAIQKDAKMEKLKFKIQELEEEKAVIYASKDRMFQNIGKVQAAIGKHQRMEKDFMEMNKRIQLKYELDDQRKPVLEQLEQTSMRDATRLQKMEMDMQAAEEEKTCCIAEKQAEWNNMNQKIQSHRTKMDKIEMELQKPSNVNHLASQRNLNTIAKSMKDKEQWIEENKQSTVHSKRKQQIAEHQKQIRLHQVELEDLLDKRNKMQAMEHQRIALEQRQLNYQSQKNAFAEKLDEVKPYKISLDNLDFDAQSASDKIRQENKLYQENQVKLQAIVASIAVLDATIQDSTSSIDTLEIQQRRLEQNTIQPLSMLLSDHGLSPNVDDFPKTLSAMEATVSAATDKLTRRKGTVTFLKKYAEKGTKENACPVCCRSMDSHEVKVFSSNIDRKVSDADIQTKILKASKAKQKAISLYQSLKGYLKGWEEYQRISKESLPKSIAKRNNAQTQKASKRAEVVQLEKLLASEETTQEQRNKLLYQIQGFFDAKSDLDYKLSKLKDDEDNFRAEQFEIVGICTSSLSEISNEIEALGNAIQSLNKSIQEKQSLSQSHQEMLSRVQQELYQLRQEKDALTQKISDNESAKYKQDALREEFQVLKSEVFVMSNEEPKLQRSLHTLNSDRKAWRERAKTEIVKLRNTLAVLNDDIKALQSSTNELSYEANHDHESELENLESSMSSMKEELDEVEITIADHRELVREAQNDLDKEENFKRHIRVNVEYRNCKKELEQTEKELEELSNSLSSMQDFEVTEQKLAKKSKDLTILREQRSLIEGKSSRIEEEVHEVQVQLKSDELRGVSERHRCKMIDYETTTMAVSDLDKYHKALDMALIEYHARKIREINTIIKELWQITYRGHDIDTIEIASDSSTQTSKGTRSYNYHVNMKKSGTTLEMRGRCSAGQKVLASIVIRLALAETFCLNCGILTLDEPTTNLDTENKIGLAQAISDIIQARSSQQNFQLVCITHDEDFVRVLGQAQMLGSSNPGHYWRVSREEVYVQFYVLLIYFS